MHLCAGLSAASWILEQFGETGANFSLQLSSQTQFAKISNIKVISECNVKNIDLRLIANFIDPGYFSGFLLGFKSHALISHD